MELTFQNKDLMLPLEYPLKNAFLIYLKRLSMFLIINLIGLGLLYLAILGDLYSLLLLFLSVLSFVIVLRIHQVNTLKLNKLPLAFLLAGSVSVLLLVAFFYRLNLQISHFITNPKPNNTPQHFYTDDFNNPNSGWLVGDFPKESYSYSQGKYYIRTEPSNAKAARVVPSPFGAFENYTVKVDARWADNEIGQEYGIIFGIQNDEPDSYYRFNINTTGDGTYTLERFDSKSATYLPIIMEKSEKGVINPNIASNTLQVKCLGTRVELYVNGIWLLNSNLPSGCNGKIGIMTVPNNKNASSAYFDNFAVVQ